MRRQSPLYGTLLASASAIFIQAIVTWRGKRWLPESIKAHNTRAARKAVKDGQIRYRYRRHLGGLKYPASKEDILEKAREEGTDEAVIDFLEQISDREYESPVAISRDMSGKRYTQEDDDDGQGNRGKRSHRRATRTKGRQAAGR
jgi:hypothetical protein